MNLFFVKITLKISNIFIILFFLDGKDTKELIKLTEEIQQINRKIGSKDRLMFNHQPPKKPVYLPLYHTRTKRSSEDDLRLIKQPGQSYQTRDNQKMQRFSESSLEPEDIDANRGVKFYIVNNKPNKLTPEHSFSPERRYMSSIEIPAEQIEHIKTQAGIKMKRSKSASSTSTTVTTENFLKKSNLKQTTNIKPMSKSTIALNVGSIKGERQPIIDFERRNLVKTEETLSDDDDYFDEQGEQKNVVYLLKLLKLRDRKINLMKEKILKLKDGNTVKTENTSPLSSYMDVLRNTIQNRYKTGNSNTDADVDSAASQEINEKNVRDPKKVSNKYPRMTVDHGVQVYQEDLNLSSEPFVQTSYQMSELVCNIPEHHDLEDLNHMNREEIIRLQVLLQSKNNVESSEQSDDDDDELADKRAEFDALDLAISDRKKKLFDLEVKKRMTLSETVRSSESKNKMKERLKVLVVSRQNFFLITYLFSKIKCLKDEISCLETTLKKRNHEMNNVSRELNETKRQLIIMKDSKEKVN